jgi:hypothetical protein
MNKEDEIEFLSEASKETPGCWIENTQEVFI